MPYKVMNQSSDIRRHRQPWTVQEVLDLQREYELLDLSILDIASKHHREVNAITYKISNEGFVRNITQVTVPTPVKRSPPSLQRVVNKRITRSMTSKA
jgi:hypothetical protein